MYDTIKEKNSAVTILRDYSGSNPYILSIKRDVLIKEDIKQLTALNVEYVMKNYNTRPKEINKTVKLTSWYAESLKNKWNTDFPIEKVRIFTLLGETDQYYHCFIKYRQNMNPIYAFLSKKGMLGDFMLEDYHTIQVDFDRYDRLSMFKDPNRRIKDTQKEGVQFLLSRKKCILADEMGYGKMEPIDSLIPTTEGFKRMGDIKVGDEVFDQFGYSTKVLKTFYHKDKDIYKVTFSDNTSCECGLEHLWVVRDRNMRKRKQGWKTLSLNDILKRGVHYANGQNKFEIPVTGPVQYSEKTYFIDPYVLGVLIGDGNLCNCGVHISIPDSEWETHERIEQTLVEGYELTVNRSASCPRHNIVKERKNNLPNQYIEEIKRLCLNVKGDEKFIPEEYKLGSVNQRLELLRGLMDSDGTITKSNNKIHYSTVSYKLAEDVRELVNSLGGTARIHSYDRSKEGKSVEYYVFIQIKFNPFHLERKANRYNPTFKKYCTKYIQNVELVRKSDAQCLAVSSDSHTYLTSRNYIVTHNTLELSVASVEGNFDCVLVICPASLKSNWVKELSYYVPERDITVVGGFQDFKKEDFEQYLGYGIGRSGKTVKELQEEAKERGKWCDNRYVIINFDILDDVYQIPKTWGKAKVEEALQNSPMLQYIKDKKSLIIIDEAHKLSDKKSGRYKTIKDLIKRGNPHSIYLATGTPITNDPLNYFNLLSLIDNALADDWESYAIRYCGAFKMPINDAEKQKKRDITTQFCLERQKKTWYDLTDKEKMELNQVIDRRVRQRLIPKPENAENLEELRDRTAHIYLRRVKEDLGGLPQKFVHEKVYELDAMQLMEYSRLWEEYETAKKELDPEKEINKQLLEGAVYRKYLSNQMVPHTIELTEKCLKRGEKVIIACCYDEELYTLQEHFGEKAVIYNGKMSLKEKDAAKDKFQSSDEVNVFIGNIAAAGVGITLTAARIIIFNNISYSAADDKQMEDRIYRIGQQRDCHIFYQYFKDTQYEKMWNTVLRKQLISDTVIKKESEK